VTFPSSCTRQDLDDPVTAAVDVQWLFIIVLRAQGAQSCTRQQFLLASWAFPVAGCGDKDESGDSQVEESTAGVGVEESNLYTESAAPAASDKGPGAAGEDMGKAGGAGNQCADEGGDPATGK
jgi:hypothetical protein